LDDYPRARDPSTNELHLDLLCWMANSAKILISIANSLGEDSTTFEELFNSYVSNIQGKTFERFFWLNPLRNSLE
jgi:hypothetical protein